MFWNAKDAEYGFQPVWLVVEGAFDTYACSR